MPEALPAESKAPHDRLTHVRVVGLFGMYDHDIPLNLESRITIIHGPNGVGKTIVLRMIHELLAAAPDVLLRVPYEEFELVFQSGDSIKVHQVLPLAAAGERARANLKYEVSLDSKILSIEGTGEPDPAAVREVEQFVRPWQYKGSEAWVDPRDGEVATIDELIRRMHLPNSIRTKMKLNRDPVLDQFSKNKCRLRLVGTDRLLTDLSERSVERLRDLRSGQRLIDPITGLTPEGNLFKERTMVVYSRDLIRRLREALSQYGALTEILDRSLVRRLIGGEQEKKTPQQLLALFKDLDEKRRQLTSLGLLNVAEDVLGEGGTDDEVIGLVSKSPEVFSLYVQDMQKKLALFDQLQGKLEILRGRTDQRFQFKKLMIEPGEGFVFKSDAGAKVAAADLSSGEQHEMILLYELLFMANEGDLVLIDEPEISLHMEWQMELLDDLRSVLRASNIDVLMATHSPAIASGAKGDLVSLGARRG